MHKLPGAIRLFPVLLFCVSAAAPPASSAASDASAEMGRPDGPGGKPAKVSWSPSKIENADIREAAEGEPVTISAFVVSDQDVEDASLRFSSSLNGFIEVAPTSFSLVAGEPFELIVTVLESPDEAGRTIGGTVHVLDAGKNLARPLVVSLKKTGSTDDDDDDGDGDGDDDLDDDLDDDSAGGAIAWSEDELKPEHFVDGVARVSFQANKTIRGATLWLTPSLVECFEVAIAPETEPVPGELEFDSSGVFALISAGTTVEVEVSLLKPAEEITSDVGGTIHLRGVDKPRRTYSSPLAIEFEVESDDDESDDDSNDDSDDPDDEVVAPAAILDAASFSESAVSPGQIVSIFGTGLGDDDAVFELDDSGEVGETLRGAMVLFDGIPARLLSVNRRQINAIVPTAVQGGDVEVQVFRGGKRSAAFPIPLAPAAPSLFTVTGTGRGQAAAINHDGTFNGPSSAARAGTVIVLFGTGAGLTDPPLEDGVIVGDDRPPFALPVRILVDGQQADIQYSGPAPGLVHGVAQWNIRIPGGVRPGPRRVQVIVGDVEGGDQATISVK